MRPGDTTKAHRQQGSSCAASVFIDGLGCARGSGETFVDALHRGPSGYISYARKVDGEFEQLGARPVTQPWLSGLNELLEVDGFVSVNTSFRHGVRRRKKGYQWVPLPGYKGAEHQVSRVVTEKIDPNTGLFYSHHDTESLRWLNAAYVDLDCYTVGLDVESTLAEVLRRQESGTIPPATLLMRSGRGLWLFWALVDRLNPASGDRVLYGQCHSPDTPARANKRASREFARVQGELFLRLRDLGADPARKSPASFTRLPGSRNTKSGEIVRFWGQGDPGGRAFVYTLPALADALGLQDSDLDSARPQLHQDRPVSLSHSERGARGHVARYQNLLRDLDNLIAMRGGGFDEGCRNRGALYLAFALHKLSTSAEEVTAKVRRFAARCRPPLAAAEVGAAVKQARRMGARGIRNDTISLDLGVTNAEGEQLACLKADASMEDATVMPPQTQAGHRAARHAAIMAIAEDYRRGNQPLPSPRQLRPFLRERGFHENPVTIWRDYHKLGLPLDRTGGRPRQELLA